MINALTLDVLLTVITLVTGSSLNESTTHISVVEWRFNEYSTHITVMLFLLIVILIKIAFQRIPYLPEYVPESLLLIVLGILFGAIIRYAIAVGSYSGEVWTLSPNLFFNYLLPPVILEASYSLYNRTFGEHLSSVLIFAVIGTILNFFLIGFGMYGLYAIGAFGHTEGVIFTMDSFLLFSSLIIAVDPVAVLAIFQDIGVDLGLYYIVFGESLLNDAVTIVVYDVISKFTGRSSVNAHEVGTAIASFLTVSLGGFFVGLIIGVFSCLLTRIENRFNSFILILLAYFSYVFADTLCWSGLISMIGCGIVQAAYAFHNLDSSSVILVHKLTKIATEVSESVIFLFIGISILREHLEWQSGFILWGLALCLIVRALVIFTTTAIVNHFKISHFHISLTNQIILIYGGLRGAVAFCLAALIDADTLGVHGVYIRHLIVTATLFIIVFTVGLMGMTLKPLTRMLKIRLQGEQKLSLVEVLIGNMTDDLLAGIEVISHSYGLNVMRELFRRFDRRFLRRFLQREPYTYDQKILQVYENIALQLHYATMQPDKVNDLLADLPHTLQKQFLLGDQPSIRRPSAEFRIEKDGTVEPDLLKTVGTAMSRKKSIAVGDALRRISLADLEGRRPSASDLVELRECLRSTRRVRLIPGERRMSSYEDTLRDVIKSRNRAMIVSSISVTGQPNLGYIAEEGEGTEDCQQNPGKPKKGTKFA